MSPMPLPDDPRQLSAMLAALRAEHRDLDLVIRELEKNPPADELLARRLKKRKLAIKDRIAAIERLLGPDLSA